MNNKSLVVFAMACLTAVPIFSHAQATPTIRQRETNQQTRIAQGVQSGQLTPGETAKLEKQQQGIRQEAKGMRAANGGKLTSADRKALRRQQNRASRNIFRKKHNAAVDKR